MSDFVKPVHEIVSVKDAFAHLLEQELVKDLHDNEGICPVCKGTGVSIVPNRYGLSDDPDKKFGMFPYQHQSISFCPNCYNGIVRYCPDCGKQLPRTTLQCDCSAAQQRKWAKEQKKLQEAFDRATKYEPNALGTKFTMCHSDYFPYNDGYFTDWDEFFDSWNNDDWTDPTQRPQYVWGTSEIHMSLDARSIVDSACEDLYEDAFSDIGDAAIAEMQTFFDNWLIANGRTAYLEDHKHAVRIPWEEYDKVEAACLTPPSTTKLPIRR